MNSILAKTDLTTFAERMLVRGRNCGGTAYVSISVSPTGSPSTVRGISRTIAIRFHYIKGDLGSAVWDLILPIRPPVQRPSPTSQLFADDARKNCRNVMMFETRSSSLPLPPGVAMSCSPDPVSVGPEHNIIANLFTDDSRCVFRPCVRRLLTDGSCGCQEVLCLMDQRSSRLKDRTTNLPISFFFESQNNRQSTSCPSQNDQDADILTEVCNNEARMITEISHARKFVQMEYSFLPQIRE
jgi:hypothetical protein